MVLEEVQLADYRVGALPTIPCLITEKVDLTWEGFTVYSKNSTLPGSEEEDRAVGGHLGSAPRYDV